MRLIKVKMVTKWKSIPSGLADKEIKDGKKPLYICELSQDEFDKVRAILGL